MQKGVFQAKKKDGTVYYRAAVTYHGKHISLGSFPDEMTAHRAYEEAGRVIRDEKIGVGEYSEEEPLSFSKWVVLINYRDNGMYIKTPIYLKEKFFYYYFAPEDYLVFDSDDLFYYSTHSIMRRDGHLFVADFGMQVNIRSRYGIKNFAVEGRDFIFLNGNSFDYRSSNLRIINRYHGVQKKETGTRVFFETKIHVNGDLLVGRYRTEPEAAVAFNKAAKLLMEKGLKKDYPLNYIEEMNEDEYRHCLETIPVSGSVLHWSPERK